MNKINNQVFITTWPFGVADPDVMVYLKDNGLSPICNPFERKMTLTEVKEFLPTNLRYLIAGTERYRDTDLDEYAHLKCISRVGIGLDNIPIEYCMGRRISVFNTPDAPTEAVAQLTLEQLIAGARRSFMSSDQMRLGVWDRIIGYEIGELKIGLIGFGRVGSRVYEILENAFGVSALVCETDDRVREKYRHVEFVEITRLFERSDVVSIHVPLTDENRGLITAAHLENLGPNGGIINTARDGLLDEDLLITFLNSSPNRFACVDVFEHEPYVGPLRNIPNCLPTPHLGSMTNRSRCLMEWGAAENLVEFLRS